MITITMHSSLCIYDQDKSLRNDTAQTHRLVSEKNVGKISDFLRILPDYSRNYPPGKFWEKFDNSHHYGVMKLAISGKFGSFGEF